MLDDVAAFVVQHAVRLRRRRGKRRLRAGQWFARGVAFLVFVAVVGTVPQRDRAQHA